MAKPDDLSVPRLGFDLLTLAEAGRLAGVHPGTIGRWKSRYPELTATINGVDRVRRDRLIALLHGELGRADDGRAA